MQRATRTDSASDVVSPLAYARIISDTVLRRSLLPESWLTSPYEILDYQSALTIHDADGMHATVARRQRIRFLQDGVAALLDHAWGDGILTTAYAHTAGRLDGSIKDGTRRHFVVALQRRMHVGEVLEFEVRREVMAALTSKTGWLETAIDHPVRRVQVVVRFPKDRPCTSAFLRTGRSTMPLSATQPTPGTTEINFSIPQPVRDVPYTAHWSW